MSVAILLPLEMTTGYLQRLAKLISAAVTGVNAQAGVTIALVHLLFNLSGALAIYPVKQIRNVPIAGGRWLVRVAEKSRLWALTYVVFVFYVFPALLVAMI